MLANQVVFILFHIYFIFYLVTDSCASCPSPLILYQNMCYTKCPLGTILYSDGSCQDLSTLLDNTSNNNDLISNSTANMNLMLD